VGQVFRFPSPTGGAAGTGGIIFIAMEIVFLESLLEASEDLGDDEFLFCPMGLWSESYRKELGGIIEN